MRNWLFIVLLLLLMPMVRFKEVNTVPAVIEREPKHSWLGWKGRRRQIQANRCQNWHKSAAWVAAPSARSVKEDLGMMLYVRRVCNLVTTRSRALGAERCPKLLSHLKHKGGHTRVVVDEKKVHCWWGWKSSEQSGSCLRSFRSSSCDAEQKSRFSDGFCSRHKWWQGDASSFHRSGP